MTHKQRTTPLLQLTRWTEKSIYRWVGRLACFLVHPAVIVTQRACARARALLHATQGYVAPAAAAAAAAAATAPPPRPSKYIDFTTKSQFLEF